MTTDYWYLSEGEVKLTVTADYTLEVLKLIAEYINIPVKEEKVTISRW